MRYPGEGQRRNGEGEYLAFRLTDTASLEVHPGTRLRTKPRDHPVTDLCRSRRENLSGMRGTKVRSNLHQEARALARQNTLLTCNHLVAYYPGHG